MRSRDVWRAARARRRALRSEIRRFTRGTRRRRLMWLGGLGALLAVILGSLAIAYGPLFSVQRITVVGVSALDAGAVQTALAEQVGVPLALVDEGVVKAALTRFPLIESYSLEARPPHELVVRITERTPVGVVESAAGFTLLDAAGVALATTQGRPAGHPLLQISAGPKSPAFAAAGMVVRSVPGQVRAQLELVRASSPYDVTLVLASGLEVVWGSADESALKAVVLESAMAARPKAGSIDVSSPDAVVVG